MAVEVLDYAYRLKGEDRLCQWNQRNSPSCTPHTSAALSRPRTLHLHLRWQVSKRSLELAGVERTLKATGRRAAILPDVAGKSTTVKCRRKPTLKASQSTPIACDCEQAAGAIGSVRPSV